MRERVESPGTIRGRVSALVNSLKRRRTGSNAASHAPATLKVARYKLILMDPDGQVVWTSEWDAGGAFDFGPRHRLWIFCQFTNHTQQEARIAEYEIELVSDEELVIGRFGSAFGDSVVVVPGQSKVLSGSWQL